jgi:hypothetical protein
MAGVTIREKDMVIHIHVADADTYFVIDGKRIYMSFHDYCGPSFYKDAYHNEQVNYDDYPPEHKLWDHFGKWYHKYDKAKQKRIKEREDSSNRSSRFYRDEPVQLPLDLGPLRPRSGQPQRRL